MTEDSEPSRLSHAEQRDKEALQNCLDDARNARAEGDLQTLDSRLREAFSYVSRLRGYLPKPPAHTQG